MKRTVLVFGLIAGLVVSVFMGTGMAIMGCHENPDYGVLSMVMGYAGMLIAFSFIFVGIKSYRDKHLGGTITFGKGFTVGILIALIASTLYVITWAVEYNLFFPDFMDQYSEHMMSSLDTTGKTAAEIVEMKEQMIKDVAQMKTDYNNPVFFTLWTYAEIVPVGLLVTLISAAILRRKPQQPNMA